MKNPILFENINYKIADQEIYSGDLVIMPLVIYYYPHTDLTKQDAPKNIAEASVRMIAGQVGGLAYDAIEAFTPLITKTSHRPSLRKAKLWFDNNSLEDFQSGIDNFIKELKNTPKTDEKSSILPAPFSINKSTAKDLSLSLVGHLKIQTTYEDHIFVLGMLKKNKLKEALKLSEWL